MPTPDRCPTCDCILPGTPHATLRAERDAARADTGAAVRQLARCENSLRELVRAGHMLLGEYERLHEVSPETAARLRAKLLAAEAALEGRS